MSGITDSELRPVASRLVGIKALGRALREARGTMSQGEAAARWGVPVSTLGALEQGVERRYHSQTLARFDAMLGRSAVAIYEAAEPDGDELKALRAEVDTRVRQLSEEVRRLARPVSVGDEFDALAVRLDATDRARVVEFMRALLASRPG